MKLFVTDPSNPERIRRPAPPAVFGLPVRTLRIASRWRSPATGALLAGEIGRAVQCTIYAERPSPCREFDTEHEACQRARRYFGLP